MVQWVRLQALSARGWGWALARELDPLPYAAMKEPRAATQDLFLIIN